MGLDFYFLLSFYCILGRDTHCIIGKSSKQITNNVFGITPTMVNRSML